MWGPLQKKQWDDLDLLVLELDVRDSSCRHLIEIIYGMLVDSI